MEQTLLAYSLMLLFLGAIALGVLAVVSLKMKRLSDPTREKLFFAIVSATLLPTMFVSLATVYLNTVSASRGPVHWHADFEIWHCGKELDLKDPKGLSNKIGTPTLHEHGDKRIHLEGLVLDPKEATLGNFIHVVGGDLTATSLSLPTNNGVVSMQNGDTCPRGLGEMQVFVYHTDKDKYSQQKLSNPAEYQFAHESNVPPADCLIIEFDIPKSRTDKLCRSYKVAEKIGKLKGERRTNGY